MHVVIITLVIHHASHTSRHAE